MKIKIDIIDISLLNSHRFNIRLKDFCTIYIKSRLKKLLVFLNLKSINLKLIVTKPKIFFDMLKIKFSNIVAFCTNEGIFVLPKEGIRLIDYLQILKHEIIHSILFNINNNIEYWISEGCATYFSGQLNSWKDIVRYNNLIKIKDLESHFGFSFQEYYYSGLYIKYLFEKHPKILFELIIGNVLVYDIENDALKYQINS